MLSVNTYVHIVYTLLTVYAGRMHGIGTDVHFILCWGLSIPPCYGRSTIDRHNESALDIGIHWRAPKPHCRTCCQPCSLKLCVHRMFFTQHSLLSSSTGAWRCSTYASPVMNTSPKRPHAVHIIVDSIATYRRRENYTL